MNKQDFTNLGGQPVDLDTLSFMQASYTEAFAAVAALVGNKTILQGVDVAGTNVSDGYINFNGEILRFVGGALATDVAIVETITPLNFDDGSTHDVEFVRYATCAVTGAFPFADLKRPPIYTTGDIKEKIVNQTYIDDNFDATTGIGKLAEAGWAILSRVNTATAGKVFVNYDESDVDFDTIGNTGGAKTHTLTREQLPNSKLAINTTGNQSSTDPGRALQRSSTVGDGAAIGTGDGYTEPLGSGEAHNNMQPYFVILKLVRL